MADSKGLTVGLYSKPLPSTGKGFANAYEPLTAEQQKSEEGQYHTYYKLKDHNWYRGTKQADGTFNYVTLDPSDPQFNELLQGSVAEGYDASTGTFDTEAAAKAAGYDPKDFMQQVPGAFGVQQWRSSAAKDSPTYTDFNAQTAAQVQRNARDFKKNAKKYGQELVKEAYDWRALKKLGMSWSERRAYLRQLKDTYTNTNKKVEDSYVNQAKNYAAAYTKNYTDAYNAWTAKNADVTKRAGKFNTQQAASTGASRGTGAGTNNASSAGSQPTNWTMQGNKTPAFGAVPEFLPYSKRFGGALNYARIFSGNI